MFEGSSETTHGGLIYDVEAINCQGCFSGYPANGLVEDSNYCISPICQSDDPPRGGKDWVNLLTAGDNAHD